ncbi:MAG: hypothetical protein GY822_29565 [Deltaproteobacteria bacterium]|nr:hypothetical protein [Deltaproteobacteria bacterium]
MKRAPMNRLAFSAFFTAAFVLSPAASATQDLQGAIPSAPDSCNTCHTAGAGSPRNDFGLDVEDHKDDANMWAAVYDLDSDGDGQTNGQELGDPAGTWESGAPPRDCEISLPGDANDTSATPDATDCGAAEPDADPEPGTDPEPEPTPICSCATSSKSSPLAAFAGLFGLIFVTRRRRR